MPEAAHAVVAAAFQNASDCLPTGVEKVAMLREAVVRKYIVHPNVSDIPRDVFSYSITDRPR